MLTKVEKLMLYSLGQFYQALNQPLVEKPVMLSTSKIVFIGLLLKSGLVAKQKRAVYRNLESLEKKKLIKYKRRMIKFTEKGLKELKKITLEVMQYTLMENYFQTVKPQGQTRLRGEFS